jgi:iron complex outermembrane recepter protein
MFFKKTLPVYFFIFSFQLFGQSKIIDLDTTLVLGLESKQSVFKTAAAVTKLTAKNITDRLVFSPVGIFNNLPGIRLEERSPGSYRLAIRGSSLRSPFGVRNIKIYYNGIPFSDASGVSYLNLIDFQSIGEIDILRGPSSSNYGSGFGGVLNLNSRTADKGRNIELSTTLGSYNTQQGKVLYQNADEKTNTYISLTGISSDGYRNHSALQRRTLNLRQEYFLKKTQISIFSLASNIAYKTPGGLTFDQQKANPKANRANFVEQNASINQKAVVIGSSINSQLKNNWEVRQGYFYTHSFLENPFISNFEKRTENIFGARLEFIKELKKAKIWFGAEGQRNNAEFDVFINLRGKPTSAIFNDDIKSQNIFSFAQTQVIIGPNFFLEGGLSLNAQKYLINRVRQVQNQANYNLTDNAKVRPAGRVSLNKIFYDKLNLYLRYSTGINPPTAAEIVSTLQNQESRAILAAEQARNIETGIKYNQNNLRSEMTVFSQTIRNGISRRLNTKELEFFVNAAKILQNGIEWSNFYAFNVLSNKQEINLNASIYDFKYVAFTSGNVNFDNKDLPGVARKNVSFFYTAEILKHFKLTTDLNWLDKMPLVDNNSIFSPRTTLLNSRLSYEKNISTVSVRLTAGAENILNSKYSAGYDINAFANRYFNPSAPRNYFIGLGSKYLLN